jgi:hypothetical protein
MFYVIQKNVFRETNYNIIFETLERLGLEYEVVEFDDNGQVDIKTQRKDVFPFGSVRLANISTNQDWNPGSFFGKNHDFSVYSEEYKENLLNYDSKIYKFGDELQWNYNEMKFIRPCKDSKLFTGQVFSKIKWEDMVIEKKKNPHFNEEMLNDLIQVTEPKKIYKEARTWIVDGKVVTSSYYRFGEHVEWTENVEPEGIDFANEMAKLYQVADTFVMDICLTPDGWKIVEINCTNCSGFYKGDMQKLVIALENKFNPI